MFSRSCELRRTFRRRSFLFRGKGDGFGAPYALKKCANWLIFSLKEQSLGLPARRMPSRFENIIRAPFCALIFISSHNGAFCTVPKFCGSDHEYSIQGTMRCFRNLGVR